MVNTRRLGFAASCLALAGVLGIASPLGAQTSSEAKPGVKAGILKCDVASGFGFIFGSSKDLRCVYSPGGNRPAERYRGTIQKFGVDIGYTESGIIVWTVVAPTNDVDRGALAGRYVGATAEATAVIGLGANALVGGGNSIALQPLSISGQQGLNVAAGIGAVTLEWVH